MTAPRPPSPVGSPSALRSMPPVEVVVVAFGDPHALAACLGPLSGAYRVVVVDNGSDPATADVAQRAGADYLDPGDNLGFAAGVNRALAELTLPDHDVLLLNPDARIEPAAVERLRQALYSSPAAACVAPAQHRPGRAGPSPVCWPFPTPRGAWREALGLGRFARSWQYVIASVLLVRGAALTDVGGFDEGFFLYAEEADWQRRATRRGWEISYCPEATAEHAGAATDSDPTRRELRFHAGVERYVRKWHGAAGWRSYQTATVLTACRRALLARGPRRRASLHLARLYAHGPYRAARTSGFVPARRYHVPALGAAEGT
jgi:GT2 family glycosyltransferase